MSSKVDSGRIETVLAAVVLLAVIALFIRFQLVEQAPPPEPARIETKAVGEPVQPDSVRQ